MEKVDEMLVIVLIAEEKVESHVCVIEHVNKDGESHYSYIVVDDLKEK